MACIPTARYWIEYWFQFHEKKRTIHMEEAMG